jgi:oligo-1,6-glucosidase
MSNPSSRSPGWWRSAVVYQIYPRSFADSDGDGIGDIRGITGRLDHLTELGVDAVWLSPIYPSPQIDNGYDISDYRAVDPTFGTLDDLDVLIAGLHERGIKLVMDLVVNHTSDRHPWFVESRDPTSAKRDWYWWRPARSGRSPGEPGAEPTDWRSFFGGPAWTYDPERGEYYLHLFAPQQPDLNWEHPDVRAAVYEMMRWWVGRGVDGFRMDVINMISKPRGLVVGEDDTTWASNAASTLNGPRLHEFLAEMNREVGLDEQHLLTVGEMPGGTIEVARMATDPDRHELNMVFTFEHVWLDQVAGGSKWDVKELSLTDLKQNLAAWQTGLADAGWNSLYLDNHDQPRQVSRFGDDRTEHRVSSAKTLATVLHLHRGTPYVYQGSELGMTNTAFADISQYADVESLNHYAEAIANGAEPSTVLAALAARSRDHARTPMQWDGSPHAGFTTGTPWLAVNPNHRTINAEAQRADPDSVFHHVKALIRLRHEHPVVVDGTFELLLPDDEQIWAFTRTLDDTMLLVIANWSASPVEVPRHGLADLGGSRVLLATHRESRATTLQPWESRVLQLARRSEGAPSGG